MMHADWSYFSVSEIGVEIRLGLEEVTRFVSEIDSTIEPAMLAQKSNHILGLLSDFDEAVTAVAEHECECRCYS